jgi:DNA polymerase
MNCKRCALSRFRRHIIRSRGNIPADILFIGEAPTLEEDRIGKSFIGAPGKLLHKALKHAAELIGLVDVPSIHFVNVCLCIPKDSAQGEERLPTSAEAEACWYWVEQVYLKTTPKHVVFLGRTPEKMLRSKIPNGTYLFHPLYILRNGGVDSMLYLEFVRELSELFKRTLSVKDTWK